MVIKVGPLSRSLLYLWQHLTQAGVLDSIMHIEEHHGPSIGPFIKHPSVASRTGRHLETGGGWGLPQENGAFQAPFLQDWDPVAPRQQPVTHAYMIILAASQIRLFCGSRH